MRPYYAMHKKLCFNNEDRWTEKETGINDVTTSKFKEVLDLLVPSYLISLPKKTKGKTQDFISFVGSKNTSDGQVTKIKKRFLLNISGQ